MLKFLICFVNSLTKLTVHVTSPCGVTCLPSNSLNFYHLTKLFCTVTNPKQNLEDSSGTDIGLGCRRQTFGMSLKKRSFIRPRWKWENNIKIKIAKWFVWMGETGAKEFFGCVFTEFIIFQLGKLSPIITWYFYCDFLLTV
jgi:hypothetical protein